MYLEQTLQLLQWIDTLQEPQKLTMYLLIYLGLPLLLIILLWLNNKVQIKNERGNIK